MDIIVFFLIPFVALLGFLAYQGNKQNNVKERGKMSKTDEPLLGTNFAQTDNEEGKVEPMENQKGTRDLLLETLTKIGCQYELAEDDDNRIFFAYQGEHFTVDTDNDSAFIQIWDAYWGQVELYDIDEVTRLQKAINSSNLNNSVITVYTINQEGKTMDVHCKTNVLFMPQIPEIEDYLRAVLSRFFRVHHFVGNEMAKLREKENALEGK